MKRGRGSGRSMNSFSAHPSLISILRFIRKKLFKGRPRGLEIRINHPGGWQLFYPESLFLSRALFYSLLARSYAVVFLVIYYILLIKPLGFSLIRQFIAVLSAVVSTGIYIGAEEVAWALAAGRMLNGVMIPEFIFVLAAFLAFVGIILAQRN